MTRTKRFLPAVALGLLIVAGALQATAQANYLTINAMTFNYIAGTPDFTEGLGLVAGDSSSPVADGIANAALPQGAVVAGFTVCGRDDANDQNFVGNLWRKTINPADSAFTAPQLMASVHSQITAGSTNMKCLKTTNITDATIDNTKWTYFVELQVGFTIEVLSATINY
jgi:hypothetical protein